MYLTSHGRQFLASRRNSPGRPPLWEVLTAAIATRPMVEQEVRSEFYMVPEANIRSAIATAKRMGTIAG